ncbi:hypothetical protein C6361_16305 [Plantactinospora sp. BC1]|nr:hypothetical protein C6361_16305 [Plantactinospora sp. BC1]
MTRRWHGAGPAILLSVLLLTLAPPPPAGGAPTGGSIRGAGAPAPITGADQPSTGPSLVWARSQVRTAGLSRWSASAAAAASAAVAPAAVAPAAAAPVSAPVSVSVSAVVSASVSVPVPVPGRFRWPLDGVPPVVRRFDPPPRPWAAGHRGVDLAAPPGATVRAAGPGVVFFAGMVAGRPLVSVAHANGLRTTYEPVRSGLAAGDAVRAGDPLGVLLPGHRGCLSAGSVCLHWGLRRGDEYLDPLLLLGLGRVRLLPVAAPFPAGAAGR